MSSFDNPDAKETLKECVDSFGGVNFFLQLVESIRRTKPHPLISKNMEFGFDKGSIKWNKVIFNDKILLLHTILKNSQDDGNLLPSKDDNSYKKVLNLLKTLRPLEFEITPKKIENSKSFTCRAVVVVDENFTKLDPVFEALFFAPINQIKKVII